MIKQKYRIVENTEDGVLKILDEKYLNVAVSVGRVSIEKPTTNSENATLKYEYDVVNLPENVELDKEFDTLLGDIIVDVIETKLENDPKSLRFNEDWKSNFKFISL